MGETIRERKKRKSGGERNKADRWSERRVKRRSGETEEPWAGREPETKENESGIGQPELNLMKEPKQTCREEPASRKTKATCCRQLSGRSGVKHCRNEGDWSEGLEDGGVRDLKMLIMVVNPVSWTSEEQSKLRVCVACRPVNLKSRTTRPIRPATSQTGAPEVRQHQTSKIFGAPHTSGLFFASARTLK